MSGQDLLPVEMPYLVLKKIWNTLQKTLGKEDAEQVIANLGREFRNIFPENRVKAVSTLATTVKKFLEKGFKMMTNVSIENDDKTLTFHVTGCYFCGLNSELKHEVDVPTCVFPALVFRIIQDTGLIDPSIKIKDFQLNEPSKSGPIGECVMQFSIA